MWSQIAHRVNDFIQGRSWVGGGGGGGSGATAVDGEMNVVNEDA